MAEAALQESEQRFRMMADAIPQLAWVCLGGRLGFLVQQALV